MYIDSKGLVVIDDKYICDFMNNNGSPEFFEVCESALKSLCSAHSVKKQTTETFFKSTNQEKGLEGETGLMNVLECKLPLRDGFTIEDVSALPHNCDMVIKRIGFPPIRIESKLHTGNIRANEVKRFESDICTLNEHGIFVSLTSGICGKGQIEIILLPTNKFAIYLSNNNYDGDIISEFVNLIYKLDNFVCLNSDDFKLSIESMSSIKKYLNDFSMKIATLKANMKANIAILNEMSIDSIERIINGNIIKENITEEFKCEWCSNVYKKATGLDSHRLSCKKKQNN